MGSPRVRSRLAAVVLAGGTILFAHASPLAAAGAVGRLLGTVTDPQGNPLMGATVLVAPALAGTHGVSQIAERVMTDARGRFAIEHLVPGLYSLRVTSPTRVPTLRNRVSVQAGETTEQDFTLSDIFTPLHFQVPQGDVSTWGDDWKWVLRTSAVTRPVLRYRDTKSAQTKASKRPQTPSQHLIGIIPGGTRQEALAGDSGPGSVLAYLRPLSQDSDLLVAGSMTASGVQGSSLATAFRKNLINGDPQTLAVVVHQLSFSSGPSLAPDDPMRNLNRAQGLAVSYSDARRLSKSVSLTAGFEADYLNTAQGALTARPSMKVKYQLNRSTVIIARYGVLGTGEDGTLLDRIGVLNAFPRVTLRGYRPRLENLNHAAISIDRKVGRTSLLEVATYHDSFKNAAVLGSGSPAILGELAGSFLPNPVSGGVILNAGNYHSSGVRAVYSQTVGSYIEASFAYALGSALMIQPSARSVDQQDLASILRAGRSQSLTGKVTGRIPRSKTLIVTSYEWLQSGRVTSVDPFGEAALEAQPYLGVLIRQPLPALAFLPAHVEALADFRNLSGQGYVRMPRGDEKPLTLTSGYRSFRGGFSVQF